MFRREAVVEGHDRRAAFACKLARRAVMGRARAKGETAAVDEQDRILARIVFGQIDMGRDARRGFDRPRFRHGGRAVVPALVAFLGQGAALGRGQGRRVGLRAAFGREPVQNVAHFGGKQIGGRAHVRTSR